MAKQTHVVLTGSKRGKDPHANRIGDVDPNEKIDVTITLAGPKLPGANDLVGTLTPAKFKRKYGAKKADADKVAKSLKKFGLKVESVSLATRSVRVSGKVRDMSKAFKVKLGIMRSSRQNDYRGRTGSLSIPAELKGIVTGVFGLDERRMVEERRKGRAAAAATPAGSSPVSPAQLEQRYNFPPGDAAGQAIAIGELGGGYFSSDVADYCNKFQRPIPNVNAVAVDAPAYTLQQILALPSNQRGDELDASVEVMMDVEIVAGLCPAANISVYFSTFDQQGWVDLLNAVIASTPVSLSVSWGQSEDDAGWSSSAITAINDRLNALRLLGVTTCISSGDDGAGDLVPDHKAHVDFPASSPFVLSVGGTMLTNSGGTPTEATWNEPPGQRFIGNTATGGGSSGGGVSTVFQRPTWQNVSVTSLNAGSIDGRVVPDVAALAGPPLYDLFFAGHPAPNGGTSASTPVWASLIARVNAALPPAKQQRFATPLLYQNSGNGAPVGKVASVDITSGNNISTPDPGRGYAAAPGYDAVTGWGVPDGVKLLNALTSI
jgi:kumamolisin